MLLRTVSAILSGYQIINHERSADMPIQAQHPVLLTPGPIETENEVLLAMRHNAESHVGRECGNVFGETLTMLRRILRTNEPQSQLFILGGSGTVGFDQIAANVFEPKDNALVLNIGYWGDSFADCLLVYGVNFDEIKAPLGRQAAQSEAEKMLKTKSYKAITITHIDTVSGVRSDIRSISKLVERFSPETLIIVDDVCSVGCEDIRFDEWSLDIVIGASQKAHGAPAGLSIVMVSSRAIESFHRRRTPPSAYFVSWTRWIPVMRSYESKEQPICFATLPTQLVRDLHISLARTLSAPLEERFKQHEDASRFVKQATAELGLKQLAQRSEGQAHGMTAFYLPTGLRAEHVLPVVARKGGAILARGPQKEIAGQYVRFSHMGVSVTGRSRGRS